MQQCRHITPAVWGLALVAALLPAALLAAEPTQPIKPEPVPEAIWKTASKNPITSAEIDKLILHRLAQAGVKPAAVIGDEQFLRRIHLDLCGNLPTLTQLRAFVADN